MQSDLPHTLYKRAKAEKGKQDNGVKARVKASDPAFKMQQEAYERKLARMKAKAAGDEPMTMTDIFG